MIITVETLKLNGLVCQQRKNKLENKANFQTFNPDLAIQSVEEAMDMKMSGFASPLPSYINRVYELQATDKTRIIAKFYRPGRWTKEAILEEHKFIADCAAEDIPVVSPMKQKNGETLGNAEGIHFAVYPKRSGRRIELDTEDDWRRIGRVISRIHSAGALSKSEFRVKLHPALSTKSDIEYLCEGNFISCLYLDPFRNLCDEILSLISGLFDENDFIRLHGDCHRGNLLERPDEGIMVIDFDDMVSGPPIQDLWLLLTDYAHNSHDEIRFLLEGYEQFRDFDRKSLCLIEPLRAMRIIYFLAWCARQSGDLQFRHHFPDWGNDAFWRKETNELKSQLELIRTALPQPAKRKTGRR